MDEKVLTSIVFQVVNTFDQEQRRALLRFATSCSRPPLLYVLSILARVPKLMPLDRGFKELAPNFSIRDAGQDANRLPTASTCVNLLKVHQHFFSDLDFRPLPFSFN
jgi:ubiquitin-protein ligase E3 C